MARYFASLALLLLVCGACGSASSKAGSTSSGDKLVPDNGTASETKAADEADDGGGLTLEKSPLEIPNAHLYKGYIVGGLPTKAAIDKALEEDIDSAISLMAPDEPGISEIGPYAASKGFRYIRFTIASKEDLNESMAWQFASTLPLLDKPGIVHSADGKRVGAIFALVAFFVEEASAEEAMAIGRAIGLGDLEDHVRDLLGLSKSP